ncbi:hypothetical protein FZEAL_176 [Fusarium zealandicum]|uniref:CAP-Gly domain-containing protein n=1 Tax=Fusarium zealandicum TaxID=1053134 RepID=A0A8H4XR46_9HYPO|nr:hypothetical protein FZEAL_176 [Fusarium zealandicum]
MILEALAQENRALAPTWDPASGLKLELSAQSPSDSEHWFKNFYLGVEEDGVPNTARWHDPRHGWINSHQVETPQGLCISRLYECADFRFQKHEVLAEVQAVTTFVLRRQVRRQFTSSTLRGLFEKLPRLDCLRRGMGQIVKDWDYQLLFDKCLPQRLKRISVFEDFHEDSLMPPQSSTSYPAIGRALAQRSLSLEQASVSYMVDARHFFKACQPSWTWDCLQALMLTSHALTPGIVNHKEIFDLLHEAAVVALGMPRLHTMALWNGRKGEACAFTYRKRGTLTWRASWHLALQPRVIEAWENVAYPAPIRVQYQELSSDCIGSHGDAIAQLELPCSVIDPVSLWQIQMEKPNSSLRALFSDSGGSSNNTPTTNIDDNDDIHDDNPLISDSGQTVQLSDGRKGIVRYTGGTHFQVGEWVGIELEEKTGKNDGSVQGERYFDCPMGYGMFVKPMMATIIAQAPAPKPQTRKPSRPSSFNPAAAGRSSSTGDSGLTRRKSLNAPSPSPVPRVSRPTSLARSPTKSPTKQMSASSSTAVSRTGTPSNARVPSAGSKTRPSVGGSRTSMGPPPPPATRTTRQPSTSSVSSRTGGPLGRTSTSRMSLTGSRASPRPSSGARRTSVDSQAGRSSDRDDTSSPAKDNGDILSPQPRSPVQARTKALEKLTGGPSSRTSTPAARKPATGATRPAGSTAASREIEDLKAKLKVLERKRVEDRDKLKQLDKVQGERDKFESVIQMLQQKYQPLQQENTELKKIVKEAKTRLESVEEIQAEHESILELATLDREMAEETAEVLQVELDALKEKAEEMELEVEILREENEEYSKGMSTEERSSAGWLQMERTNERLREALLRLRDLTQASEEELKDQVSGLEEDLKEFNGIKEEFSGCREKLEQAESAVEDLRQQLDNALGAEDMIEDLTERNMSMSEQIEELKAVIDDLESLKEINDELEVNHVQNEKEMQEELDFKDSVIAEQARRSGQQDESLEDMEYTLSRFRELVTSLQSDLDDMRASQAVTEGESEKLNDRSRAMMDLNMKLQLSAAKAQVKTIDLELRRLEAQEAEQHLEIVKLFLPDTYKDDQDSVLALLRFRRLAFKANLLNSFIRERLNGQPHPGHEDDVFAGCDASDKLVWVSNMCDRFVNDMTHCSIEQFSKYQNALHELEPVERALNVWIDGLRRDELKEKKCADELHRTIALLSHLGEVHISSNLANYADDVHMKAMVMQSHLDSAAVAFNTLRSLVQRVVPEESDEEELAQHFSKKSEAVITHTRGAKVIAGKAVRALQDLRTRSISLLPDTNEAFDQCCVVTQELADLARQIGIGLHGLLTSDEGRTDPFTYVEVQNTVYKTVLAVSTSSESDIFSTYLSKLRTVTTQIADLAALATDLDQVQEFDVTPAPWKLRSRELKALKTIPVDAEEELRRLKEEHSEARRTIAQRDEHLSTAVLKIETLESRMRDAQANIERITNLQNELEASGEQIGSLKEDIEKQDRELKNLESERDKWKKIANDSRAFADGADAAGAKAGQERAVATAREMDALKQDIESLQSAVRYLREDNRRARTSEQHKYDWLAEPLKKPATVAEKRRNLIATEGKDVLGELVKMASSASLYKFSALPEDKLAWKPARSTPQYHAAKQMEDFAAWSSWQASVLKKAHVLQGQTANAERRKTATGRNPAARLRVRMPGADGKMVPGSGRDVQIVGSQEWEALQGRVAV